MKYIQIGINLTDDLGVKGASIQHNDTGLPSDSAFLRTVSIALLRSVIDNADELAVKDLLYEMGIETETGD